jgi:hypothetical protein
MLANVAVALSVVPLRWDRHLVGVKVKVRMRVRVGVSIRVRVGVGERARVSHRLLGVRGRRPRGIRQPAVVINEVQQARRLERRVLELDVARPHLVRV